MKTKISILQQIKDKHVTIGCLKSGIKFFGTYNFQLLFMDKYVTMQDFITYIQPLTELMVISWINYNQKCDDQIHLSCLAANAGINPIGTGVILGQS